MNRFRYWLLRRRIKKALRLVMRAQAVNQVDHSMLYHDLYEARSALIRCNDIVEWKYREFIRK